MFFSNLRLIVNIYPAFLLSIVMIFTWFNLTENLLHGCSIAAYGCGHLFGGHDQRFFDEADVLFFSNMLNLHSLSHCLLDSCFN